MFRHTIVPEHGHRAEVGIRLTKPRHYRTVSLRYAYADLVYLRGERRYPICVNLF